MNKTISEQALETAIVADLVTAHYVQRPPAAFDKALCLDPGPLVDFVEATQPKEWKKFVEQHREAARDQLLKRVADAITADGTVTVLREGVKATGCKFRLAFWKPETSLNPDTDALYQANQFTVMRQARYSEKSDHSLDLVLFLNGLPLFTAELKNPLNDQDVTDAIVQYRRDRDQREPLFALGRCLAHFAVDPLLVYVTTQLKGDDTAFLPFNRGDGEGKYRGAGNPPPKLGSGFSTDYLWREVWARDSVLDLMQYFVQDVRERDEQGKLKRSIVFPRYHQLESVRELVAHAREHGAGQNYLVQHSAGSGKSNSIAWLAHRLVSLHDHHDKRVFDSVIVVTDRVALDRQLSRTVTSFEQTAGLVEHIDEGGKHLKQALEAGKQIIVTTLQKFPVVLEEMRKFGQETLPWRADGLRFALILDEAHSSQGGDAAKEMKSALRVGSDDEEGQSAADLARKDQQARGRMQHVSTFAFTATPKHETLEIFGVPNPGGSPAFMPFSLYSMRQAIEEGFILDVLKNFISYRTYWTLLKKVKEDPKYDRQKASKMLTRFVSENPKTIREKVHVIAEHLAHKILDQIDHRARAMLVTSSRQQAVSYKLEIDRYLDEKGYSWKAVIAFSGTVKDEETGKEYTEAGMNGFSEAQTAAKFATDPYRLLIVANKFQTGFDQPLLHTMYVDKRLAGEVNAVQTLSRLNRTLPPYKTDTCVLDFADNAELVKEAFGRYFGQTSLAEATDPNDLHKVESALKKYNFLFAADVESFAAAFYKPRAVMEKVYAALKPVVERVEAGQEDDRREFRGQLHRYADLYSFLGQVIPFADPELEQLYQFCRCLLRVLPVPREEQPRELKKFVDMSTVRLVQAARESLSPALGKGVLEHEKAGLTGGKPDEVLEPLSEILKLLNDRFGTSFAEDDKQFLETLEEKLDADVGMASSFAVNTRENARLTFDHKVRDHVQDMIDVNFRFFKQINDKPEFAAFLNDLLFDRYAQRKERTADEGAT
ncbi:MAG TPA: type I restriction endonuclease [Pirellulales bacterium]|nr:type I restriction endonuclease [Pirellulales bacterium]